MNMQQVNISVKQYLWVLLYGLLCLLPYTLSAQQRTITGRIVDGQGAPLPEVTIKDQASGRAAKSNQNGIYSIAVDGNNAVLVFTFLGYKRVEEKVGDRKSIDVTLLEDAMSLDDAVVIGYQDIQRRKTTGAISTVKAKEFENTPYATFDGMLQGRVAGLTVLSTSGEPGANNIVNIRGSSNVNLANNTISAPLYVIDGIIYDVTDIGSVYGSSPLQAINPNDIESVDILKDASASSIYGARAANGVIIVKTKRPMSAIPEIRVSAYYGVADRPAMKPITVGAAERRLKMGLLYNGAPYNWFANDQIHQMLTDSLNPAFNNNTDWQGLFLRSAKINNINASIGANSEKFSYRFSLQRYYEQGVMIGYENENITPRMYIQVKPKENVQFETNLFVGLTKAKHGSGEGPTGSKYPFATWGFPSSFWYVGEQEQALYTGRYDDLVDDDRTTSLNGNSAIQINKLFIPELSFRTQISYNIGNNTRDLFQPGLITSNGRNQAQSWVNQNDRWELESYFNYAKTLKDHNLSAVLGYGMEKNNRSERYMRGYTNNMTVKTITGIPSGPDLFAETTKESRSRISFFGRLSYDYKGKYLLSASYRQDASSRYSRNNRWAIFPSISGGWVLSEEPFFEPLKHIFSFFKFRGSYGLTGLDPGSYYAQYPQLTFNGAYQGNVLDNGGNPSTVSYNGMNVVFPAYTAAAAAPSIKWERTPQFNAGFDMNLFNDRISLTADYYIRDSKNLTFNSPTPITSGYVQSLSNYVDVRNTGIELTLNTRNLSPRSEFQWSTNFNLAYNKNYVTGLPNDGREFRTGAAWMERTLTLGQPLYSFQVWDVSGVFASDADVPVDPQTGLRLRNGLTGNYYKAGDPAPRDLNGDYIIDYSDKVSLGDPNPKFVGGLTNQFSYKGFSLQVLLTFIQGRKLWNGYLSDKLQSAGANNLYNVWGPSSGVAADFMISDFWQNQGDHSRFPNLFSNTVDNWHIAQSYFVEDASFLRLKNIQLGYTLPTKVTERLRCKAIRFYGMLDNVHIWSNSTTPDPEAVEPNGYSSGNGYPIPKKYTFGVDVTF